MRTLLLVFEDLASLRIHSDFIHCTIALDVEGVAETAAPLLPFQFLVGDRAGTSLQSDAPRLLYANFCTFCRFSPVYANKWIRKTINAVSVRPKGMATDFLIDVLLKAHELDQLPAGWALSWIKAGSARRAKESD